MRIFLFGILGSVLLRPMSNWDVKARFTEMSFSYQYLGGGFKHFLFSSLPGEDSHFD